VVFHLQSIKCSECGKVFRNTALANYHAEKSGHDQFEESTEEVGLIQKIFLDRLLILIQIKPLTEEEKKQKLEDLRVKMAEKRATKAKQELLENKANEMIKRKAAKVHVSGYLEYIFS